MLCLLRLLLLLLKQDPGLKFIRRDALERPVDRVSPVAPAQKKLGATVLAGEPMEVGGRQVQAFSHLTCSRIRRDSLIQGDTSLNVLYGALLLNTLKHMVLHRA